MAKREWAAWEVDAGAADTARLLVLLAQAQAQQQHLLQHAHQHGLGGVPPFHAGRAAHERVFECKTCSRQFPTFQALGGHRASHKRPRVLQQQQPVVVADHAALCLGREPLQLPTTTTTQPAKPRVHECPVCGLEFAIGQALGGHMRRHRAEAEVDAAEAPSKVRPPPDKACDVAGGICLDLNLTPSENCAEAEVDAAEAPSKVRPPPDKACDVAGGICLDLNLTPSENCAKCRSVVVLGAAGQGVHKTLAMLDCSL